MDIWRSPTVRNDAQAGATDHQWCAQRMRSKGLDMGFVLAHGIAAALRHVGVSRTHRS